MKFEDNTEAVELLNSLKDSIEDGMRIIYNLGYKIGKKDAEEETLRNVSLYINKMYDIKNKVNND